ncbi:hypothetical protein, partial [Staphylococcus aureus]|uniref:hypothetical protein n=1 Tax=Staphylococcus aureus TaxID=1280 RepID=UPI0039BE3EBD
FTLLFDFTKGGKKAGTNNTGVSLVPDEPKKKDKQKVNEEKTKEPVQIKPVEKEIRLEPVEPK